MQRAIRRWRQDDAIYGVPGLLTALLRRFAMWAPFGYQIITGEDPEDPYLLRVYLMPEWYVKHRPRWLPSVFLHNFFRGDGDKEYHNHPWRRAWSVILTEGYVEGTWDHERKLRTATWRDAGSISTFDGAHLHRIMLLDAPGPWTIFATWMRNKLPKGEEWSFYNAEEDRYIPWKKFVEERRCRGERRDTP